MRNHHVVAVPAAAVTAAALLVDTAVVLATGERTFVTDDALAGPVTSALMSMLTLTTFGSAAWVLHAERGRFAAARRAARIARRVLVTGLVMLAVGMGLLSPALAAAGLDSGVVGAASGVLALTALAATFGGALVLGLALVGRNPIGMGGVLLQALGPVMVASAGLALVAPAVASPVYCTMLVILGVSLVGVRARPGAQPASREAMASPTSAV